MKRKPKKEKVTTDKKKQKKISLKQTAILPSPSKHITKTKFCRQAKQTISYN